MIDIEDINDFDLSDEDFTLETWFYLYGDNGMHTVKVAVSDLLAQLKLNRADHIKEYNEAVVGYKKALEKELQEKLKTVRKTGDVSFNFKTVKPQSYENSFIEAITQLEWTVDKEVDLDQQSFKQLVMNQWAWQSNFTATTAMYKGAR
jgi:sulfur carrier protein ThiS